MICLKQRKEATQQTMKMEKKQKENDFYCIGVAMAGLQLLTNISFPRGQRLFVPHDRFPRLSRSGFNNLTVKHLRAAISKICKRYFLVFQLCDLVSVQALPSWDLLQNFSEIFYRVLQKYRPKMFSV